MSLMLNHCSNPECHRPYTAANYREAIALLELGNNTLEYRVFSLCESCLQNLTTETATAIIYEVIQFETLEKGESITTSKNELANWKSKYASYKVIKWGHNRIDLDEKLAIK